MRFTSTTSHLHADAFEFLYHLSLGVIARAVAVNQTLRQPSRVIRYMYNVKFYKAFILNVTTFSSILLYYD